MARKISGIVSSDAGDKTIQVTVTRRKNHPIYGKSYLISKKITAHDEKNEAKIGDKVIIAECKPISKTKRFVLDTITEHAHQAIEISKTEVEKEIDEKLAAKVAKKEAEKAEEAKKTASAEEIDSDKEAK